jgi:hypothetical protein
LKKTTGPQWFKRSQTTGSSHFFEKSDQKILIPEVFCALFFKKALLSIFD